MNRFLLKTLKWGLPLGLLFFQTKPIFTKEPQNNFETAAQDQDRIKKILQSHQKLVKNVEKMRKQHEENQNRQNKMHQSEQQSDQQQIESRSQKQISQLPKLNQNKQRVQAFKNGKQQSKEQIKVFQQVTNQQIQQATPDRPKRSAIVSPQTPGYILDYLKLYNIKITVDQKQERNKIQIKNKVGDTCVIDLSSTQDENSSSTMAKIANFVNPPRIIRQKSQIKGLFQNLAADQYIIATYIPSQKEYIASKIPKSDYDTFTNANMLQVDKIQEEFKQLKYESVSNKNCYLIVRNPEVARQMKINPNKIGDRYVFYKTSPNHGMETSSLLQGQKFTIKTVPLSNVKSDKNIIKTGLYSYINEINYDGDMLSFIKSLQAKKQQRKLLVIYSRQRRPQFIKQLKSVLLKVAKIMKQDVLVVLTQNQKLLPKYFQIAADDFVTVRLLDISKSQPSLLSLAGLNTQAKKFYSRTIMKGPFSVQNVCKFIRDKNQWKQYYERKRNLTTIQSIISQNEQMPNNTVVLYWKHGCKGCELTLDYLQRIKQILKEVSPQMIYNYQIQNPAQLKNVHFRRFNVLNEQVQKNRKDHDTTPKLKLYKNGKMKDLNISEMITKITAINVSNEEQIHHNIMKEIIQAISRQMESGNEHL